jgi:hypothetical protein
VAPARPSTNGNRGNGRQPEVTPRPRPQQPANRQPGRRPRPTRRPVLHGPQ